MLSRGTLPRDTFFFIDMLLSQVAAVADPGGTPHARPPPTGPNFLFLHTFLPKSTHVTG